MSDKVIIVAGYGTGISNAVANKFGTKGYKVALLSRTQSKLDAAVKSLKLADVIAKGFAVDLSDPKAVKATVDAVRSQLGQINVLFWNPYGPTKGILESTPEDFVSSFNTSVTGLVAAIQAVHADLKATKGAVLVTGGGFALESDAVVHMAVQYKAATLAVAKAAQRKLVHLAHEELKPDGIFVGEVTVMGMVSGTPFDPEGKSPLTPQHVADKFIAMEQARDKVFDSIGA